MACNCGVCQSCNYFETGLSRGYDDIDEQEGADYMQDLIEQLEGIREDLTSTRVKHSDRTESALVHITKAVELLKEDLE